MGFGFVVAKFGIFLQLSAAQRHESEAPQLLSTLFSSSVGIILVLVGAVTIFVAAWQHRSFVASLPAQDIPVIPFRQFPWMVAFGLGLLGLALAAYLTL